MSKAGHAVMSVALFLLTLESNAARDQEFPVDPSQLMDRYASSGETPRATFRSVNEFIRFLEAAESTWLQAGANADRERRSQVLALLALETASKTTVAGDGLRIIEWACGRLRDGPHSEFERRWMAASSSKYLRQHLEASAHGLLPQQSGAINHLSHAEKRVPNDSRVRLMRLSLRPEFYSLSSLPGTDLNKLATPPTFAGVWAGTNATSRGALQVARTIRDLEALVGDDEVGAEALVHLGFLKFHRNELSDARTHFSLATVTSRDRFVRNFAQLGLGLALDATNQTSEALVAYRAAVDAMPLARASAIQLAVHLYLSGRQAEAYAVVDRAFAPLADELEPWRNPVAFDRLVEADVARLRSLVGMPSPSGRTASRVEDARVSQLPTAVDPNSQVHASLGPPFGARTDGVAIDVLIEAGRRPVDGLTASDIELLDNGVRQEIEVARVDTMPIDVSLVVDLFSEVIVGSRGFLSPMTYPQVRSEIGRIGLALGRNDRLRLMQVDGNVGREVWSLQHPPFPLDRLVPVQPIQNSGHETSQPQMTYGRMQDLYDVVAAALVRNAPAERRHVVIVLTDGVDGGSVLTPELFLRTARGSEAAIYLLRRETQDEIVSREGIRSIRPYGQLLWPPRPAVMEEAARSSGGTVYLVRPGALLEDFASSLRQFRSSYVVRYQPLPAAPGVHNISIRVRRAGEYVVKSRKSYTIR